MAWRWLLMVTAFSGALGGALGLPAPAGAIPRLDLRPYPAAGSGEQRWVIQLPGVLPPAADPALSANPADWRVELIVGQERRVDCNRHRLGGQLSSEPVKGWGYTVFRLVSPGPMISTRMACPPGEPLRSSFVKVGSKPFVLPYNASLPIVVYTPKDMEVRWRLWKAETRQQRAEPL
ncbi:MULTISPECIES: ecotin [Synechococcales]|uniref:ecotin n=2 Tax=Synechococcus TaxID=1129 RepID=UPI0021A501A0|nr:MULTISPECIES: ecotin family protein [unclassified Synechococcus]